MDSNDYRELIRQLAYQWAVVDLPDEGLIYSDYIHVIGSLLTATQDVQRTKYFFKTVLQQAVELNKSSLWVEQELRFETLAEAVERSSLLTLYLKNSEPINDAALDLYNERLTRFS